MIIWKFKGFLKNLSNLSILHIMDKIMAACFFAFGFLNYFFQMSEIIMLNVAEKNFFPTRMGFEPTRAEPNGLAVHRLNHSATSSVKLNDFKVCK